jgi:hypothetical protein
MLGQHISPIFNGQEVQEDFLTLEDGIHELTQNVSKGLSFDAVSYTRRAQILSASQRRPEIMESIHLLSDR